MFGIFFAHGPVGTYAAATQADAERFRRFFHGMLQRGVYFAPSAFEAGFLSSAHDDAVLEATLAAAREAMRELAA